MIEIVKLDHIFHNPMISLNFSGTGRPAELEGEPAFRELVAVLTVFFS